MMTRVYDGEKSWLEDIPAVVVAKKLCKKCLELKYEFRDEMCLDCWANKGIKNE